MKYVRLLSLVIALLLCMLAMPASAENATDVTSNSVVPEMNEGISDDGLFAGDLPFTDTQLTMDQTTYVLKASAVAKIGDKEYTDLATALKNWTSGTTLTLLENCSVKECILVSGPGFELNLNGKTLSSSSAYNAVIALDAEKDCSLTIVGGGVIQGQRGVAVQSRAKLTVVGKTVFDCTHAAFDYCGGQFDLSEMGDTIAGLKVYASTDLTDLQGTIALPQRYAFCDDDGNVTNRVERTKRATIKINAATTTNNVNITSSPVAGGVAVADKASAPQGETITLTITPAAGYLLDSVTVTDANGQPVTVEDDKFTMPGTDVTINVTFKVCDHTTGKRSYTVNRSDNTKHDVTHSCCNTITTEAHSGGTATCTAKAVCQHCNVEYGDFSADNHTADQTGYIYTDNGDNISHRVVCICQMVIVEQQHHTVEYTVMDGYEHTPKCTVCHFVGAAEMHTAPEANGMCACGELVLAKLEKENQTRYVTTAEAAGQYGLWQKSNVTLLADQAWTSDAASSNFENALDMNGKTLTVTNDAVGINGGSLTIKNSADTVGTIESELYCLVINGGTLIIGENVDLSAAEVVINYMGGKVDLSKANQAEGWCIQVKELTTFGYDDRCDIKLPDGYAAYANNQIITSTNGIVTIKAHTIHATSAYTADDTTDAITAKCGCGKNMGSITLTAPTETTYDGNAKGVAVKGDLTGYTLTYAVKDGEALQSAPVNAGTYTATLAVGGASVSVEYAIVRAMLQISSAAIADVVYKADGLYNFVPTVTFNGLVNNDVLTVGKDYTVAVTLTGDNKVATGVAAEVDVTLTNTNYELANATVASTVNINVQLLESAAVTVVVDTYIYNGKEHKPGVTVTVNGAAIPETAYTVEYTNNTSVGEATVIVNFTGNYSGSAMGAFTIAPLNITGNTEVSVSTFNAMTYTGAAQQPKAQVKIGELIVTGEWSEVTNVTDKATFTASGNFTGSVEKATGMNKATATEAMQKATGLLEKNSTSTVTLIELPEGVVVTAKQCPEQIESWSIDNGIVTLKGNASVTTGNKYELVLRVAGAENYNDYEIEVLLTGTEHEHSWTYTADDTVNTITAVCGSDVGVCPVDRNVVVTLIDPTSLVYDGTPKEATVTYSKTDSGLTPSITNKDGDDRTNVTEAGFTVTMTLGETSVSKTYKITPASIFGATVSAENQIYTGAELKPAVTVTLGKKTTLSPDDYDVAYTDNINAGTAAIIVTGKRNYKDTAEGSFTITKSGAAVTVNTDQASYTYGETITVEATVAVSAPATRSLRSAPAANQMALYLGDMKISDAVDADSNGVYTMTCKTTDKVLAVGENIIMVKYVSDGNKADAASTVKVTVNQAELKVSGATAESRDYEPGNTSVEIKDVSLSGIFGTDHVAVEVNGLTGTISSANAGVYTAVTLPEPLTLTGTDAGFYTLTQPADPVATNVTIKPVELIGLEQPTDVNLDVYCATPEKIIEMLPTTITGKAAGERIYQLSVEWTFESGSVNTNPGESIRVKWQVEKNNFTCGTNVPKEGSITVKNGSALAVEISGENQETTYNGSPFDVSGMFTIGEHAGAASYSIVEAESTGAGVLKGSELTIIKAGKIVIKLTTALNVVEGMSYAAGETTATLMVNKGEPACTVPTGLSAAYGQKLENVDLSGFTGWSWKTPKAEVGNAGSNTHKAIFTPDEDELNLWNTVEKDVTINVSRAEIQLNGVAATYLGDAEEDEFTYGEIITVKVKPAMPMLLAAELVEPAPNQMALFRDTTQISAPVSADADGAYTMTYATTNKALPAGDSKITVRYVGTNNYNDASLELPVRINPAKLTIAGVTVQDRPYRQGNMFVAVNNVELAGKKVETDDVAADVTALQASVEADTAGEYSRVMLPEKINLKGTAAQFYDIKGSAQIAVKVTITRAEPTAIGNTQPSVDKAYVSGITLGDLTPMLPEGVFNVPGTVTWKDPADTSVVRGQAYEWIFTPDPEYQENYMSVVGSLVIYPVAPSQPPVIITAAPPVVTPTFPVVTPEVSEVTPTTPVTTPTPPVVTPTSPVVTPKPVPPTVFYPVEDQFMTLNEGNTVIMSVSASNADSYQWYVDCNDGVGYRPVSGANAERLIITVTNGDNGNVYLCRITNADGTISSPVFILEVLPAVDVPVTGDKSKNMLWAALLLMSAAGLLLIRKFKYNMG